MRPKKNLKLERALKMKICPYCKHKVPEHFYDHMVLCSLTRHPKFSPFIFPRMRMVKETLEPGSKATI